jgi:outer membrane protein OmpA-like peptidoglycan-associated protein
MSKNFKQFLLSGAAVAAIAVAAPESANAQIYTTGPGFYLSVEGRYLMNAGDKSKDFWNDVSLPFTIGTVSTIDQLKQRAQDGWGGKLMLGYRFTSNWDIAIGGAGGWLDSKKKKQNYDLSTTTTIEFEEVSDIIVNLNAEGKQSLKTKLDYYVADFEAGYNWTMGKSNIRLFGGVRYANFNQKATSKLSISGDVVITTTSGDSQVFSATGTASAKSKRKTKYWGIGPRLGVNGIFALGNSGFHMFGGVSGAALIGKYTDKRTFNLSAAGTLDTNGPDDTGGIDSGGVSTKIKVTDKKKKSKVLPMVDGEIGLGYSFNAGGGTAVALQAGYRGEAVFGAGSEAAVYALGGNLGKTSDKSDHIIHGPFVRLVATFGTPVAAAVAPTPAVTPPAPVRNYLVFFDFDRSNITADAQRVIEQAAAAAKSGNTSRVQLTGHTDRSGSEAYNLALSMRRGEAVKQALVRLGIPAASIAVIGRGESQPLVPTADGVREPQNRRVEIML